MALQAIMGAAALGSQLFSSFQQGKSASRAEDEINRLLSEGGLLDVMEQQAQEFGQRRRSVEFGNIGFETGRSAFDLLRSGAGALSQSGFDASGALAGVGSRGMEDILRKDRMQRGEVALGIEENLQQQLNELENMRSQLRVQKAGLDTSGGLLGGLSTGFGLFG